MGARGGVNGQWLALGYGYVAQALERLGGGRVLATSRSPALRSALDRAGTPVFDPAEPAELEEAVRACDSVLVSAPPDDHGCPGLAALAPSLQAGARPAWIGYLSSTSVYGDLGGRWAFEGSSLKGKSLQAVRRTAAERDWLNLGERLGLTVCVFRLGAIYGQGRSALDRLAETVTVKPGQVFSRVHVDDIAAVLAASMARPRAGGVYNVADDAPSSAEGVLDEAARLLGRPSPRRVPFNDAELSDEARRFWRECRRVSNARAKAELGWRLAYPSYREGLAAINGASAPPPPPAAAPDPPVGSADGRRP